MSVLPAILPCANTDTLKRRDAQTPTRIMVASCARHGDGRLPAPATTPQNPSWAVLRRRRAKYISDDTHTNTHAHTHTHTLRDKATDPRTTCNGFQRHAKPASYPAAVLSRRVSPSVLLTLPSCPDNVVRKQDIIQQPDAPEPALPRLSICLHLSAHGQTYKLWHTLHM